MDKQNTTHNFTDSELKELANLATVASIVKKNSQMRDALRSLDASGRSTPAIRKELKELGFMRENFGTMMLTFGFNEVVNNRREAQLQKQDAEAVAKQAYEKIQKHKQQNKM